MTLASIHKTAATSPLLSPPVENRGKRARRAPKPTEPLEAHPYARGMFAYLAEPFIIPPTDEHLEELRLVFDAEGDGLLETITKFHCLAISAVGSDRVYEYGPSQIAEGLAHLSRADELIGHNIQGFDLPALLKLYDWAPPPECRVIDTLIAGRLILPNLDRLDGEVVQRTKDAAFGKVFGKYSLEAWGVRLGLTKIGAELENWTEWTPEIQARCVRDVGINKALWRFLRPDGYSQAALELEHTVAAICDRIVSDGVPFDVGAAEQRRMDWETKRAALAAPLRKQFPAVKNINSRPQLGALLESRGWVPAKRTPKTQKPVVDDELLESLPATYPEFAGLAEYFVIGRRLGQLAAGKKAWIDAIGPDSRIHGGLVHIGTPHSRAKHLGPNLAQVPNGKKGALFASECRRLFRHPGDRVFVCCDQNGLQDRGFAHYLSAYDNGAYARVVAAGADQHWVTVLALGLMPEGTKREKNDVHIAIREGAKRFRYAFLFGAGGLKLGHVIADIVRAVAAIAADAGSALGAKFWADKHPGEDALKQIGKRVLDRFINATPGLRQLRASLTREHRKNGWLEGLDGRRVPTEADYKALNRIVTSSEAIICKTWLAAVYAELCARFRYGSKDKDDVWIALWIHDEIVAVCRSEIAEQVGEILVRHARKAGEPYGFRVPLEAEFKIGRDWAGTPLED
jgi:DNA polymerase I-like protein with 3'-5' exonuclease and polymerase domains